MKTMSLINYFLSFLGLPDVYASFRNFTLPKEYSSSEMFVEDETYNPCQMYALKDTESTGSCRVESFDNTTTIDCQSFVYDTSLFPETLTTKLDLVRLPMFLIFYEHFSIVN